jgi:hypothetical protein
MSQLTLAVREFDGEFDAIGFYSYDEAVEFCQLRHEYRVFETGFFTVKEAFSIFGDEVSA